MITRRSFPLLLLITFILLLPCYQNVYAQRAGKIVEAVRIEGTRRLRNDDILARIDTRPNRPYSPEQVRRDFQTILALGFFEKTEMRVLVENGSNGCLFPHPSCRHC